MNRRHARGESEYIYITAYDSIYKYKFFPAGQPTAEATGPRLRRLPLRVLFCWPVGSLLVPGYVAPLRPGTSSLVAGLSWTPGEYCWTQKRGRSSSSVPLLRSDRLLLAGPGQQPKAPSQFSRPIAGVSDDRAWRTSKSERKACCGGISMPSFSISSNQEMSGIKSMDSKCEGVRNPLPFPVEQ